MIQIPTTPYCVKENLTVSTAPEVASWMTASTDNLENLNNERHQPQNL